MTENIFEAELKEQRIFRNLEVLSPHYVPPELPHREKEIKEVTRLIAPILRNQKPSNIFIYGKTGTGKTCVVRYVTKKLLEFAENPEKNTANTIVRVCYMNCKVKNSKYQVLLRLAAASQLDHQNALAGENTLLDRSAGLRIGLLALPVQIEVGLAIGFWRNERERRAGGRRGYRRRRGSRCIRGGTGDRGALPGSGAFQSVAQRGRQARGG